jgi:hypothetical protein
LEASVDQRYYLSPRAALGILLRSARRGKELPPHLRTALEDVVKKVQEMWATYTGTDPQKET